MACNKSYDAKCVTYTGGALTCSGIAKNDALDIILSKLDTAICNAGGGSFTSVGITSSDLLVVNSPITTSGNINIGIAPKSVTYTKFQDISASRLLGRYSAVTGIMQEITVGSGLNLSASGVLTAATGTLTSVAISSTDIGVSGSPITSSGTITLTLPTVNSNVGTFNNVTVNGKGLVTAASNVSYITGNQNITLSGDVTGSGTTAITTTIPLGTVTYGKIQNVGIEKLLGNPTGSSTSASEIGVDSTLDFTGTNLGVVANTTNQKVQVLSSGSNIGTRKTINFIPGSNVTITPVDNSGSDRIDVTIASSGGGSGTWGFITGTLSDQTDLNTALSGKQPIDSDLTAIAGLSPANDDIIQRKSGAWTNRTIAQYKTDLALTKSDVGLSNVDNTSDSTKNAATVTLTNKTISGSSNTITNIGTSSVTDAAVTYAKIQDVTQARLLGRYTASTGDVQEISIDSTLSLNSTTGVLSVVGGGGGTCVDTKAIWINNLSSSVASSTTQYTNPTGGVLSATESSRIVVAPASGTIKNLFVFATGSQSGTGSLVVTVRTGASVAALTDSTLALTIAASTNAGTGTVYSSTVNTVSVNAGDLISIKVRNNATATSLVLGTISLQYTN